MEEEEVRWSAKEGRLVLEHGPGEPSFQECSLSKAHDMVEHKLEK